jgi:hypothetical protein
MEDGAGDDIVKEPGLNGKGVRLQMTEQTGP